MMQDCAQSATCSTDSSPPSGQQQYAHAVRSAQPHPQAAQAGAISATFAHRPQSGANSHMSEAGYRIAWDRKSHDVKPPGLTSKKRVPSASVQIQSAVGLEKCALITKTPLSLHPTANRARVLIPFAISLPKRVKR